MKFKKSNNIIIQRLRIIKAYLIWLWKIRPVVKICRSKLPGAILALMLHVHAGIPPSESKKKQKPAPYKGLKCV